MNKLAGDFIMIGIILFGGVLSIMVNYIILSDEVRGSLLGALIRYGIFGAIAIGGIVLLIKLERHLRRKKRQAQ